MFVIKNRGEDSTRDEIIQRKPCKGFASNGNKSICLN